ncbi:unnamed protein product [Heligmosomoides polygyrus]|uniref:Lipocalin n=1 Tax=Heligmosomoides polygyrus TaxID=6339 RepID=A0A183G4N6_HELPZ|nr:unnamed protein product [Heligmosomoides polygyrus]
MLDFLLCAWLALAVLVQAKSYTNQSMLYIPGMETMASDKYPHYTVVESVSRTKWHRHRREVIAGPIYDWNSYEIPYQIWGGDCELLSVFCSFRFACISFCFAAEFRLRPRF